MSFNDLRDRPVQKNYGLHSDWTSEERRFKSGLPEFVELIIEFSRSYNKPIYCYEPEKIINAEVVNNKEVVKQPEIITKISKDETIHSVESINVQAANAGLALQPARQESSLSTTEEDPFDSIIESNKPSNYSKPSDDPFDLVEEPPKKAQAPTPSVSAAKVSAISDEELFGEPISQKTSSPAPAANPIASQPSPATTTKSSVADPAAESARPAKPSVTAILAPASSPSAKPAIYDPVNDPEGPALADSYVANQKKLKQCAGMSGFDFEAFQEVVDTANQMLARLPEFDLDSLMNSLGEYSVNLDLDYLRENQHILSDRLLEIQAKRDSMFSATLRLTPLVASMKSAYNYYMDVGVSCSTESSREKRLAQMMKAIPQFLIRYSDVNRTKESVDHAFQHLEGQYECISRLITVYQIKNKVGDISRGATPYVAREEIVPFDPPYRDIATGAITPATGAVTPHNVTAPKIQRTETPAATGKAPSITADDEFVNRSMSQPLANKKFENLESFVSGTKPARKTTSSAVIATGEVEW
mgnify:CR=1 FL=1